MENVNKIQTDLIGKEMMFTALDNYMVSMDYYSVMDDGSLKDIKEDGSVVYTRKPMCQCEITICFDIVYDNAEDEDLPAFYLKVTSVDYI